MELMERVKAFCNEKKACSKCRLQNCCPCDVDFASDWDIESIRKLLGAETDGAVESVVEEIVVPKKITTGYATKANPDVNARMINEIIDCLEQIKERMKG